MRPVMYSIYQNTFKTGFLIALKGMEYAQNTMYCLYKTTTVLPKIVLQESPRKNERTQTFTYKASTLESFPAYQEVAASTSTYTDTQIKDLVQEEVQEELTFNEDMDTNNEDVSSTSLEDKQTEGNKTTPEDLDKFLKNDYAYKWYYNKLVYYVILKQQVVLKDLKGLVKNISENDVRQLVDYMELNGIVSPQNANYKRGVLVPHKYSLEEPINKLKFFISVDSNTAKSDLRTRLRFMDVSYKEFHQAFDELVEEGLLYFNGGKYLAAEHNEWKKWRLKEWMNESK